MWNIIGRLEKEIILYFCCFLAGDWKISDVSEDIVNIFVSQHPKIHDLSYDKGDIKKEPLFLW